MATWIQNPSRRKLGLAPRDHLKTSVWTIARSVHRIILDPNIRICILNETASNAQNFLNRIEAVFDRNATFRWLFPELIPDKHARWSAGQMQVPRTMDFPEPTIEVFGVGGASTSHHYNVVHEDDLVGKEAGDSQAVMQKAIDQHKLAESLLNDPNDEIVTVGTRWAPYDLVDWMVKNERNLDCFYLQCIHPTTHAQAGHPVWPKRFSLEYFDDLKLKLGPGMFNLQYMNQAIAEGVTDLNPAWLRRWNWTEKQMLVDGIWRKEDAVRLERPLAEGGPTTFALSELWTFEIVDPCHSPESGDARAAVIVVGLTPEEPYNIVVLHAYAKKVTPNKIIDEAWSACQRFNVLNCGIEVVGAQLTYFYWIPTIHPEMPIRKLKCETALNAKHRRIKTVCPTFGQQGRIYTHASMFDFHEEWDSFPSGKTVDLLDAFSYGPQLWAPPEADAQGRVRHPDDDDDDVRLPLDGRSLRTGY